jgi:cytochrome P450
MATRSGPSFAPIGTDLPDDILEIARYDQALEVFRSQSFHTELRDGTDALRHGTVLRLNGPGHPRRRRSLNRVLRHDNPQWYVETFLDPSLAAHLRAILGAGGGQGQASADLCELIPTVSMNLAAAMIGIGPPYTTDPVSELEDLVTAFREMAGVRWIIDPAAKKAAINRGVGAKRGFDDRYFKPALAAHRELIGRYQQGALGAEDLPRDFLTLVAAHSDPRSADLLGKHVDPTLEDTDLALREAITSFIIGAVDTTTIVITWCVDELSHWFELHPEDYPRRIDDDFLYRALAETLRLHPTNPATLRQATEDVQLSDGTTVRAGEMVALLTGPASRDQSVYGSDADAFNPRREFPQGVLPYGLAFGSGVHMCYGQPLVLGSKGTDGSLVRILFTFYQAGMRPDHSNPGRVRPGTYKQQFASYPVLFDRMAPDP